METAAVSTPRDLARTGVNPWRIFMATWLGWMLDGFDNAIYIYVIVPALTELLPASGIEASGANIARFGGLMFTVFMFGWACSMFWGWFADRFGRIPAMCITVLLYSIFTALCGVAPSILAFGVFRFLTGFGIGGEWAAGAPLLQESVPEEMRTKMAAWLHTGTPVGFLLAAIAALVVLPLAGWRGLFMVGCLPALLAIWLRLRVPESPRWRERKANRAKIRIATLFAAGRARATWTAAAMLSCIIFGLWSSTFWIPTLIITWQRADGASVATAQQMGSMAGFIISLGSLVGCGGMAWIVRWLPERRRVATIFFVGSLVCNILAYLVVAELLRVFWLFVLILPLLGFFTNGVFALYTIWLPELFPTEQRALGSGFAFSFGRIFGAFGPAIVGTAAAWLGSYPIAITAISLIYLIGLPFITLAPETGGRALEG